MPQNLHDAHRQWAVRPPDERFPSLEALFGFLDGRRRASEEETRPLRQIEVKIAPDPLDKKPLVLMHQSS